MKTIMIMEINSNNEPAWQTRYLSCCKLVFVWFLFLPMPGIASVLSDLAADLVPGEFVELEVGGSVSTCQAMHPRYPEFHPNACPKDENGNFIPGPDPRGCPVEVPSQPGNILEFTDKATWDSIEKEVYVIGTRRPYKPWDQGFSKYSEASNSWVIMDQPPFGFGPHGYDHNAMDVVGRKFYQTRVDTAREVWSMDMDTGVWQQIPDAPVQAGQFAALDYFPELERLVYFNALGQSEYALYNTADETWEGPISLATTPFGAISHFSEYSKNHGVMFYGGGYNWNDASPDINESRRFYMLDGDQLASRLADPPLTLGQFGAGPVQTIDPNTGNLVVFQGELAGGVCPSGELPIWEYDLVTDTWGQTGTQRFSDLYCGMDTAAVPLYEYGVIFIVSVKSQTNCKVFLYKHSPLVPTAPIITIQPASQSAEEGSSASFNITASGGSLEYQWYRDGDPIAGATSASYTLESVAVTDDQARFHSTVRNNLGNVVSEYATLTVVLDTTAPVISGASVRSANTVDIHFSEALDPATAEVLANYQITAGIQVLSASLSEDQQTVQLQTDTLQIDTVYTVSISGVQDVSSSANEIIAGSSVDIVFAAVMNFDNGQLPLNWIPLTEERWSVVMEGGSNALFLNTSEYNPESGNRLGEHITSPDSYTDFSFSVKAKTNESSGNGNADYAMVFGFVDGSNYYYMLFNRTQSNTQLFKVASGVRELIGTATAGSIPDEAYHEIELRRIGNSIEVRFDGALVLAAEDSTFPSGKLGLGSYNDSAYFDDIRISGASSGQTDLILEDGFE